jgi:hypothetical protein
LIVVYEAARVRQAPGPTADVVELAKPPSTVTPGSEAAGGLNRVLRPRERVGPNMFATIRRYEATDQDRTSELVKKVDETLVPSLSELPGFGGYYLLEAGNGVMSSISLFDTSAHADESTQIASDWVRDQKLESALPNAPKITSGEVVVHKTPELVQA